MSLSLRAVLATRLFRPVTFLDVRDHPKCEVLLSPLVTHVELSFSEVHAGADCPTTYRSLGPAESSSQALRSHGSVSLTPTMQPCTGLRSVYNMGSNPASRDQNKVLCKQ